MKMSKYTIKLFITISGLAFSLFACNFPIVDPVLTTSASFVVSIDSCLVPCKVNVLNTSQNAISYKWDWGDGTGSETEEPTATHTYQRPIGDDITYMVTVVAKGVGVCEAEESLSIHVKGVCPVLTGIEVELTDNEENNTKQNQFNLILYKIKNKFK